jgi:hypothetical protein
MGFYSDEKDYRSKKVELTSGIQIKSLNVIKKNTKIKGKNYEEYYFWEKSAKSRFYLYYIYIIYRLLTYFSDILRCASPIITPISECRKGPIDDTIPGPSVFSRHTIACSNSPRRSIP